MLLVPENRRADRVQVVGPWNRPNRFDRMMRHRRVEANG